MSAGRRDPRLAAVRAWLEEHAGDMVSLTARLASVESPSGDAEGVLAAQDLVEPELAALGYRVRRLSGGGGAGHLLAVPAHRPRARPVQMLLGHLDTVWPRGTLEVMPVGEVDGRLHGPGVFDMKGGVVQGLFALRALRELGLTPSATPIVFLNGDEEVGSPDSVRHVERLARVVARTFVLEPAFGPAGALKTARKGVGAYRLRFRGRSSHAGLAPAEGRSAVLALARTVVQIDRLNDPDRGTTVNVGVVEGGTRANVVAAEAHALVDVRVRTDAEAAEVDRAIRSLEPGVDGVTVEIDGGLRTPPLERTARNRALWEAARTIASGLGFEVAETEVGGGSDGNHTSPHTATLDGLGAVGDGAHAVHEHLVCARMAERSALVAGLLMWPVGGEDGP